MGIVYEISLPCENICQLDGKDQSALNMKYSLYRDQYSWINSFAFGVHFMLHNNIVHEWLKDRAFSKSKFANNFNKTGCAWAIFSHFLKTRVWHVYALSAAVRECLSSHGASIARIILFLRHFSYSSWKVRIHNMRVCLVAWFMNNSKIKQSTYRHLQHILTRQDAHGQSLWGTDMYIQPSFSLNFIAHPRHGSFCWLVIFSIWWLPH
jgi:hypothetical protein